MTLRKTMAALSSVIALMLVPASMGYHWDGEGCSVQHPTEPVEVTP